MTRYEKIAISLPTRVAERARRAVRAGKAASVSAYVVAALEKTKSTDLDELLDEMLEETGGPLTPAEERAADRALGFYRRKGKLVRMKRRPKIVDLRKLFR